MLITLKHLQGNHGSAVQHFRLAEVAMLKNKEVDEESARTIWNGLGISYNSLGEPDKVSQTGWGGCLGAWGCPHTCMDMYTCTEIANGH